MAVGVGVEVGVGVGVGVGVLVGVGVGVYRIAAKGCGSGNIASDNASPTHASRDSPRMRAARYLPFIGEFCILQLRKLC